MKKLILSVLGAASIAAIAFAATGSSDKALAACEPCCEVTCKPCCDK